MDIEEEFGPDEGPSPSTKASGPPPSATCSVRTRSQKLSPIQPKTMPISSPDVANSQTPATTENKSRPRGTITPTWSRDPRCCMARPPKTTPDAVPPGQQHGQPLQGQERQDLVDPRQEEHPQRVRVHLDPFTDIEHGAVTGQKVADHPEIDEGVLLHPAIAPGPSQHDDQRYRQHHPGEGTRRVEIGVVWFGAGGAGHHRWPMASRRSVSILVTLSGQSDSPVSHRQRFRGQLDDPALPRWGL